MKAMNKKNILKKLVKRQTHICQKVLVRYRPVIFVSTVCFLLSRGSFIKWNLVLASNLVINVSVILKYLDPYFIYIFNRVSYYPCLTQTVQFVIRREVKF